MWIVGLLTNYWSKILYNIIMIDRFDKNPNTKTPEQIKVIAEKIKKAQTAEEVLSAAGFDINVDRKVILKYLRQWFHPDKITSNPDTSLKDEYNKLLATINSASDNLKDKGNRFIPFHPDNVEGYNSDDIFNDFTNMDWKDFWVRDHFKIARSFIDIYSLDKLEEFWKKILQSEEYINGSEKLKSYYLFLYEDRKREIINNIKINFTKWKNKLQNVKSVEELKDLYNEYSTHSQYKQYNNFDENEIENIRVKKMSELIEKIKQDEVIKYIGEKIDNIKSLSELEELWKRIKFQRDPYTKLTFTSKKNLKIIYENKREALIRELLESYNIWKNTLRNTKNIEEFYKVYNAEYKNHIQYIHYNHFNINGIENIRAKKMYEFRQETKNKKEMFEKFYKRLIDSRSLSDLKKLWKEIEQSGIIQDISVDFGSELRSLYDKRKNTFIK